MRRHVDGLGGRGRRACIVVLGHLAEHFQCMVVSRDRAPSAISHPDPDDEERDREYRDAHSDVDGVQGTPPQPPAAPRGLPTNRGRRHRRATRKRTRFLLHSSPFGAPVHVTIE